jgi:hypothetical protein
LNAITLEPDYNNVKLSEYYNSDERRLQFDHISKLKGYENFSDENEDLLIDLKDNVDQSISMHNNSRIVDETTNNNQLMNVMLKDDGFLPDGQSKTLPVSEKNKDPKLAEISTAIHGTDMMQKSQLCFKFTKTFLDQ